MKFILKTNKQTNKQTNKNAISGTNALLELLFDGEQDFLSDSKGQLQGHTDSLINDCARFGMKSITGKTEIMSVGPIPETLEIFVNGQLLAQATKFAYVGNNFAKDGKLDKAI